LIVAWCLCGANSAFAQSVLRPSVITSNNAAAAKNEIDTFVRDRLNELKAGTDVQRARDGLTQPPARRDASPSFQDAYATSVAAQVSALGLDTDSNLRTRLNAAIVVEAVSRSANVAAPNTRMAKLILAFIKDQSEPVALWGIKGAEGIIPAMLVSGEDTKDICNAIIAAVKAHPESGFIAEDAYRAMMIDVQRLTPVGPKQPAITIAMLKSYVPYAIALYEYRAGLYKAGIPAAPNADTSASVFFSLTKVWGSMNFAQQAQVLNLIVAAASGACGQINQVDLAKHPEQPEQLTGVARGSGMAIGQIPDAVKDPKILKAAKDLANISSNTPQPQVEEAVKQLDDAVKSKYPATVHSFAGPAQQTTSR
jgi:hypothetical protein